MSKGVLVIAEQSEGEIKKTTFEALSEGKRLSEKLGVELKAVILGSGISGLTDSLTSYGADKIIVADQEDLGEYLTDSYTEALSQIIEKEKPGIILTGATSQGKDLSARLSARIDAPLAMDCIEVMADGDQCSVKRPMYGGKLIATVTLTGETKIVTIRPKVMVAEEKSGKGEVEKVSLTLPESQLTAVEKRVDSGKVELTEADVIVSGGRGVGGADYSAIEALAKELNGAVGASRSAVDEGWRPASDQVGQTGKVVSPNLYIACGISGAIQHLAGMSSSKVIVAINKDPEAPIFQKADYGIVGNLFDIVPAITEEIKKQKG